MSFFDAPSNTPREIIPEGKYTAIPYLAVDCGTRQDTYQGETKLKREIYVAWELVDTAMADGRPFVIGNFYTITSGKFGPYFAKTSNANKMLRGWTGMDEKACSKPHLIGRLIADQTPCLLTVGEQQGRKDPSKIYSIIESIKPHKGAKHKNRHNDPVLYALADGPVPESVPAWLRSRISECIENTTAHQEAELSEDIPF